MLMITQAILKALKVKIGCRKVGLPIRNHYSSLNQCFHYETDKGSFFVKVNTNQNISMYSTEAEALSLLSKTGTIRVPNPFYYGYYENQIFLILEYIDLFPHNEASLEKLGDQLAKLHLTPGPDKFGFEFDNTIGTSLQSNTWMSNWVEFYREKRLGVQLQMIEKNFSDIELIQKGNKLLEKMDSFFSDLVIRPSLLHGDLWSGNTAKDKDDNPVIFDPASYYGHHEMELSIADMFGGFTDAFYHAYHTLIPKSSGFEERKLIYQLYHYLNHYNLFGTTYRSQSMSIINHFV